MIADPALPLAPGRRVLGAPPPRPAARARSAAADRRRAAAAILPGKIAVPALPADAWLAGGARLARQAEIADRDHAAARCRRPVAVGEGVELLDIAERMMGLLLHPGAQAGLQRAVRQLERAGRQRRAAVDGQHARLAVGDRDDHRDQFGGGLRRGDRRRLVLRADVVHGFAVPEPSLLIACGRPERQ